MQCTDHRWRGNTWDSRVVLASPASIRKILASFRRDLEAQAIEAGSSGLYQSALAHGPKLGDRG